MITVFKDLVEELRRGAQFPCSRTSPGVAGSGRDGGKLRLVRTLPYDTSPQSNKKIITCRSLLASTEYPHLAITSHQNLVITEISRFREMFVL
jgi:hypothetical protein